MNMKYFSSKLWFECAYISHVLIYFVILSFTSTDNSPKHLGVIKYFLCCSYFSKLTLKRRIYTLYVTDSEAAVHKYSTK